MESLLMQIEEGLKHNLYYLSLFVSLCVPDICAAIESPNGQTNGKKYKAWIDQYLVKSRPEKYGDRLSAEHIYQFRCALLHQGRTKHNDAEYNRIMFFEPGSKSGICDLHCCVVGAAGTDKSLVIDIAQFCNDTVVGANAWLKVNRDTSIFETNYKRVIKRYPNGINPVFGCAVIG